ncbi:uncharacterized protein LOC132296126 [Cornus florida]|uniref:uncharacterized protein LOC132296126 n=1 Tax=Cornus florida TaxID=4283 RepID=UPI0028A0F1D3|nr:uncharacterized protein LOC132296126 [Cornus florida]
MGFAEAWSSPELAGVEFTGTGYSLGHSDGSGEEEISPVAGATDLAGFHRFIDQSGPSDGSSQQETDYLWSNSSSWAVVKNEVMSTFQEFHSTGVFEKSLNASFIVLIPKKGNASDIKDFRPISLVGCIYKLIAKVFAQRMRGVMDGIISDSQNAFVGGRQILDSVLIADECVDSRLRNGVPGVLSGFFGCSRGVRQCDPLSSFLFLIVMKGLSKLMRRAENLGLIKGFRVGRDIANQVEISHLLFADDTLAVSGLKVKVAKSVLVLVRNVQDLSSLVTVLGCRVSSFPIPYLGLPLRVSPRLVGSWDSVIDRIEQIQRNFLWGGRGEEFKYHLVRWEQVCKPIKLGGLGIRRLIPFNQALLGKWLWRYGKESHRPWRRLVSCRYGDDVGGWTTRPVSIAVGVGAWKFIRKGWDAFSPNVRFRVRDGSRVRFWEDLWCGNQPLCRTFPRLFSIAADRHATVANCYQLDNSRITWNVLFRRSFQDWELEDVSIFLDQLYRQEGIGRGYDNLTWIPSSHGRFEVRSLFLCMSNFASYDFPWKTIWRSMAPIRVAFFVWTTVWGKILTIDNSRKRGNNFVNWCCICKQNGESVDHLLLHCSVVHDCWNLILGFFGMYWVMPRSTKELIHAWRGCRCVSCKNTYRHAFIGSSPIMDKAHQGDCPSKVI